VTSLSIPCRPPRSGVFITVVVVCRWTPLSPFSAVLPLSGRRSKLLVPDNKLEARFRLVRLACFKSFSRSLSSQLHTALRFRVSCGRQSFLDLYLIFNILLIPIKLAG
jgi:hypothetical protein